MQAMPTTTSSLPPENTAGSQEQKEVPGSPLPSVVTLLIDSREQIPLLFPSSVFIEVPVRVLRRVKIETKTVSLPYGDYILRGYEHVACVERKRSALELSKNLLDSLFQVMKVHYHLSFRASLYDHFNLIGVAVKLSTPVMVWDIMGAVHVIYYSEFHFRPSFKALPSTRQTHRMDVCSHARRTPPCKLPPCIVLKACGRTF